VDRILPHLVDEGLPDGGEFLVASMDDNERAAVLVALLIWHGFLPMAGDIYRETYLLGKIHEERCVLHPGQTHIGKKAKKRAKGFHLTVDKDWAAVVKHIQKLTFTKKEGDCWLTDPIVESYQAVASVGSPWSRGGIAFHSVELWHTQSGELVAGEIGYTCGSTYSSCTGFCVKDKYSGAGTVQLAALGCWLSKSGFEIWDLGMKLDYKIELGGHMIPRSQWAARIRHLRERPLKLRPPSGTEGDAHLLLQELGAKGEPGGLEGSDSKKAAVASAPPSDEREAKSDGRDLKRDRKPIPKEVPVAPSEKKRVEL